MTSRSVIALTLVVALYLGIAAGQKTQPPMPNQDVQAMKADVQRMRALIMQMQNNLGSVTSTTTPLKHQFELEIEMWQVALGDMERRLARAESSEKRAALD